MEERLAKVKWWEDLFISPTLVVVCALLVAAYARPPYSTCSFGLAPDVAPICAEACVAITMATCKSPSVRARISCLRPVLPARTH